MRDPGRYLLSGGYHLLRAAMPSPPPEPAGQQTARRPPLLAQIDRFWLRVTEGLELSQLWRQFHVDARASYRLYQRDFDARKPREAGHHTFFHTLQELA